MTLRYCSVCIRALIFFRLPESAVAFRHSPLRVLFRRNKCFANHRRTRRQFHSGFGQDLKNSGKTARCLSATCLSSIIALQNFPNRFPYSGVKIRANRKVCPAPELKVPVCLCRESRCTFSHSFANVLPHDCDTRTCLQCSF